MLALKASLVSIRCKFLIKTLLQTLAEHERSMGGTDLLVQLIDEAQLASQPGSSPL